MVSFPDVLMRNKWASGKEMLFSHSVFSNSLEIKNPLCNAGDIGPISGWGPKMPHAAGELSP